MINLEKLFQSVDIAGTDLDERRVAKVLDELAILRGCDLSGIEEEAVQGLPHRMCDHLKSKGTPPSTIRNLRYRLNKILKAAVEQGLLDDSIRRFQTGIPIPPKPTQDGPEKRRYHAFLAFETWCATRRIHLESITDEHFVEYRDVLKADSLRKDSAGAEARYGDLIRTWRERSERGQLPVLHLPRWNDGSREPYGLSRAAWPPGVEKQFQRFERGARNKAKPNEKRWGNPLREVSIGDMVKEVREFLGYLQNVKKKLIYHRDLKELLGEKKNVIDYMTWKIKKRSGGAERGHHQNTLDRFAAFLEWLGGEAETVTLYRLTAKSLRPVRARDPFPDRPMEYGEFTAAAMKALCEKREQFEKARKKGKQTRISAACAFRDAMIFALLICRPMRSRNVHEMKLGANLLHQRDGGWSLRFLRHEAKAKPYSCKFPERLVPWLEFLLEEVRPILRGKANTDVLFLTNSGRPMSPQDLWKRLRAIGNEYLGILTNPHLFRYLIPSAYLARYPEDILVMQALLGHRTLQTTLRCYVHTYSRLASRKVADTIRENCPNLSRLDSLYPTP